MTGMEVILPIAAAVGGAGLSAYASRQKGKEQSLAAGFEADQYRIQAENLKTQAAQDEARRREDLVSSLESIEAVRAGRGVSLTSPTGRSILEHVSDEAQRDINIERANTLSASDLSRRASYFSNRKAKFSYTAGLLGAGTSILEGAGKLGTIYGNTAKK